MERSGGTALVTGGAGSVGSHLAERLANVLELWLRGAVIPEFVEKPRADPDPESDAAVGRATEQLAREL